MQLRVIARSLRVWFDLGRRLQGILRLNRVLFSLVRADQWFVQRIFLPLGCVTHRARILSLVRTPFRAVRAWLRLVRRFCRSCGCSSGSCAIHRASCGGFAVVRGMFLLDQRWLVGLHL